MHPTAVSELFIESADLNYRGNYPELGARRYYAYNLNPKYFSFIKEF